MSTSLDLKQLSFYFPKSIKLFSFQHTELPELMFLHQNHNAMSKDFSTDHLFANGEEGELSSFYLIPSLKTLLAMPLMNSAQKLSLEKKVFDFENMEIDMAILERNALEEIRLKEIA
mmetsp:Transcript_735/g.789  ORF Transcript_735/g.789 Transcript_735/m.789 type:complete len:117 (+) Transcript_735:418-768(+)